MAEQKINGTAETSSINLVCMDDVKEKELQWLYWPYIPRGKVTLCGANPGSGKTYVMCYAVACVSTGKQFFNICPFESEPENAIYINSEDDLGDTLKKRLRQCGADMKRVYSILDPNAELTFNNPRLEEIVKQVKPALLVMDPMQSYIGAGTDMNSPNKTRAVLNSLVRLAEKYNVAIVLVCHFNKSNKGNSIEKILGSMDIVGVSRSYLAIGNVPREKTKKYMSHEKSSNALKGVTKLFHIDPDNGGIVYDGDSDMSMDDYEAERRDNGGRRPDKKEAAKLFIMNNIPPEEGKRKQKELINLGEANGFKYDTLNRARAELGIESKQDGYGGEYYWHLPKYSGNSAKC